MNHPKVTLCIPTYNAIPYVSETIESLTRQTYDNIQIKVFDNSSTDDTLKVLKKAKERELISEVHGSNTNIGGEANFTRCIAGAEGDYTGLFHADDVYAPEIVERAVREMQQRPDAVAVACHAKKIDSNGQVIGERFIPPELRKNTWTSLNCLELLKLCLKYGNFITCPSVIARSAVYKEHIQQWDGQSYKSSADLDVWLRMSELGPLLFSSRPSLFYRVSNASYSVHLFRRRTHRHDLFLVLDKYIEKYRNHLSSEDLKFYQFLNFKDGALRSFNIIKNRSGEAYPQHSYKFRHILWCGLQSKFHFKFLILGLAINIVRFLLPQGLRKYFNLRKTTGS